MSGQLVNAIPHDTKEALVVLGIVVVALLIIGLSIGWLLHKLAGLAIIIVAIVVLVWGLGQIQGEFDNVVGALLRHQTGQSDLKVRDASLRHLDFYVTSPRCPAGTKLKFSGKDITYEQVLPDGNKPITTAEIATLSC